MVLKRARASTNCPWHSHRESLEPDTSLTGNNQLVNQETSHLRKTEFTAWVLDFFFKASQEKGKNKVKSPKRKSCSSQKSKLTGLLGHLNNIFNGSIMITI